MITSFCQYSEQEALFFSGSKDCTVRLWDTRKPQSAGLFGLTAREISGGMTPRPQGHATAISSIDSLGNLLLTADQREAVMVWDVRSMGSGAPLMKFPMPGVLKLSLISGKQAVIVTSQGLHVLNMEAGRLVEVPKFPDGRPNEPYNDLRWSRDKSLLFAAGGEGKLDVYNLS